jgi:iron complex outermembrane recepter protein
MKRFLFSVYLIVFSCTLAYAESILLQEIEVKAEKETMTESLEVREVRETNAKDVGEALQSIGGINKIRKGGIANDIVLRGFQGENIKVLVDGALVYGACPNHMDPASFHVDFAEVDRIDVMKGAFDLRNPGSLAGTVDMKTRSASPGFHGEVNFNYGSYNSFSGSGNLSYGTEKYGILGGLSYKSSDPYEDGDGRDFTELYPETSPNRYHISERDSEAYSITTGWTKVSFAPVKNSLAEISYARQEADDVLYPYLLMDADYDDTDRLNFIYRIDDISSVVSQAKVQVYWNEVEHSMTDNKRCSSTANPAECAGNLPRRYSMKTLASTETVGGKILGVLKIYGETAIGVDYYLRNWDNTTTLRTMGGYADQASVPDVDTTNIGIFIEQKNSITDALVLTAGLRLDNTKTEADINRTAVYDQYFPGSDTSKTDTSLSGNIELTYAVSESFDLFAGFGHTVRIPDPLERYFALQKAGTAAKPDWVGNPALNKVENNEIDLGMKYTTGRVFLKTMLFYSSVNDFLTVHDMPLHTGISMRNSTAERLPRDW